MEHVQTKNYPVNHATWTMYATCVPIHVIATYIRRELDVQTLQNPCWRLKMDGQTCVLCKSEHILSGIHGPSNKFCLETACIINVF